LRVVELAQPATGSVVPKGKIEKGTQEIPKWGKERQ